MSLNRREFLKALGLLAGAIVAWKRDAFQWDKASLGPAPIEAAPAPWVKGAQRKLGADQLLPSDSSPQEGISAAAPSGHLGPFTSGIIAAPLPFIHAGIVYSGVMPSETTIHWEARGSQDGLRWTRWYALKEMVDLRDRVAGQAATSLFSLDEDGPSGLYQFLQVRASLGQANTGEMPVLSSLTIAFIDPTAGPFTSNSQNNGGGDLSPSYNSLSTAQGGTRIYFPLVYKQIPPTPTPTRVPTSTPVPSTPKPSVPKPSVTARTAWACPDGESSPNWRPDYQTVTDLIIHHTDTPNSPPAGSGWDAWVRSIWYYHTYQVPNSDGTFGWGDIGYNYLIDPNGVIYEGRAGGDDVVGGHALQYNWGSLGAAFLGTYSTVYPSAAAQTSMVNLLGWKAAQRGINPLVASAYFVDKYLPTLFGHRDCLPTTCPGDYAYSLLPQIRQYVAAKKTS